MRKLVLTLALTLIATPAAASISVIEASTIDRDKVLVGDLFTVDNNDLALKPVGDAPAPGQTNTYDVNALRRVAKAYEIAWSPSRLDTKALVKRDSTEITNKEVVEIIRTGLAEKTKATVDGADNVEVLLDRRALNVQLPASVGKPIASLVDVSYNPLDYRFKGTLMVESADNSMQQPLMIPVTGRALPQINVPVLTRNISRGDVVNEGDLEFVAVPANKLGADIITQASDLVGKEARRDLTQGNALRSRDFRAQQLVKRGGIVTMVIERGPLRVSAKGRALGDAGVGDTVRVLNIQSNRTIEGTVAKDGSVSVHAGV